MIKKVFFLCVLLFLFQNSYSQSARKHWVDSVYEALSQNERIGQLFMVPIHDATDERTINEIENLIKSHEVAGLIFHNVHPQLQANLVRHFQSIADTPLLIATDTDQVTAPDSMIVFPPPLILAAIPNDTLIYRIGGDIAWQLKATGVNMMIGINPRIQTAGVEPDMKLFGQEPAVVTAKSVALMRGLKDNGIIPVSKNFPLRSLAVIDIEDGLPVVNANADSLQRIPYLALITQGPGGILAGTEGYGFKVMDNDSHKKSYYTPEALAAAATAQWVRTNMHHNGLSLLDLRTVKSVSEKTKPGDVELFAFKMGNDLLMYPGDVAAASRKIKKAARKSSEYEAHLGHAVRRVLEAKFDAGLWKKEPLTVDNITARLNDPEAEVSRRRAWESAVTVVRDARTILPIRLLENRRFAFIGDGEVNATFIEYLKKYVHFTSFNPDLHTDAELGKALQGYTTVLVAVNPDKWSSGREKVRKVLAGLPPTTEVIACDFGAPGFLATPEQFTSVITAYSDTPEAQRAVPQIIFGALPASGVLPFAASQKLPVGTGIPKAGLQRLAYSLPEAAKMNGTILRKIDSIAMEAIRIHATPGCQIWVARKGKVIYEKSFGHLTYDAKKPVDAETIYDLASVTKVMATLQTAMFLYEHDIIDLNRKVSFYLPELKTTNKKDITILDMLTRQSGLVPFIPMYPQTIKDTTFLPLYYSRKRDNAYPLQVSSNLFASTVLRDSVWSWIVKSKLGDKPIRTPYSYKYSDLGFLILQRLAEKQLNQPLDEFMQQNYYEPLGAYTTGFTPLNRFSSENIAPTEEDKIYRRSAIAGTVHDERAAMLGGVAGHAGLFSNANDLGKMGQMLVQGGTYGGIQYYKPETLNLFTAKRFKSSRRGIGWDKPIQSDPTSPTSLFASPKTFGHTGFTGTCIWIDPEFDLVYIFLSNRVYPDRNNKLSNANIRTRIQDVIYRSIFGYVDQQKQPFIVNDYAINSGNNRPME